MDLWIMDYPGFDTHEIVVTFLLESSLECEWSDDDFIGDFFCSESPHIFLRRAWQPTPVFLPGEFLGQRSLVGYSPWGLKELDTTEAT